MLTSTPEAIASFKYGCEQLAEAFMHHKDPELHEDYKLGDQISDYFIGSEHTDYASFADGSEYFVWSLADMYIALRDNIPYEIMAEHADWHDDDFKKPEGWHNLWHYAMKRKDHMDMTADEFQRMLQRDYYMNRADNLTDARIAENKKYMEEAMEKFRIDNNL